MRLFVKAGSGVVAFSDLFVDKDISPRPKASDLGVAFALLLAIKSGNLQG